MTDTAEQYEEQDGPGLDAMLAEWEDEVAATEAADAQPTKDEIERARKLAEKMNSGFLWIVNRTQCPHVKIDQVIDREEGDEAFQALAERWGGEVPEWMQRFEPYVAAGLYMGTAIVTARQAEAQAVEILKQQAIQQQQGGADGQKPEPRPGE